MKKLLLLWCIVLLPLYAAFAQKAISGTLTDEKGEPLVGASVTAKGTTVGGVTDENGNFTFVAPEKATTLVASFVGYKSLEIPIGSETVFKISLTGDAVLDEVVVIGYGTTTKTRTIGAVSTINSKALDQIPIGSMDNMLQGQSTGVQVTGINGRPGQQAFIRVRGVGSITAGRNPLYVVDGVPLSNEFYGLINANDVDKISVLKDAASASIYGSRASNGVILVTTKKGKMDGEPRLTFRYQYGVKKKTEDNYKLMNQQEKLQYEFDLGYTNRPITDSLTKYFPGKKLSEITPEQRTGIWNSLSQTDWFENLLQPAKLNSYEVNLSGGSKGFRYFFSLQNYDEQGIANRSSFNRKGGRINVEYEPTPWFKIGNFTAVSGATNKQLRDRNNVQSPFRAMYVYNTYEPEKLANGNWNLTHQGFSISEAILNNVEDDFTLGAVNNLYGEFTPFENLRLRSSFGVNLRDFTREYYLKPASILDQFVGDPAAPGSKTDNGVRQFNYVWSNTATWLYDLNKDNHIELLGGTEFTSDQTKSYSLATKGFPTDKVNTQNNGATPTAATTAKADWTIFSLFGRATYNFADRYVVEGSIRRDGSSRFGFNQRFGTFWSVGAGWNLANEGFMKNNLKFMDMFKLRGSVGTSGNFEIGNYPSLGLYALNVSYNNLPAEAPLQLENAELTWEKNFNYGVGVDFEMFESRLRGTLEYYNRKTFDLIFNQPISQTTGFATTLKNIGDMVNKGVEASLKYDIVRNRAQDYRWTISASITQNKNTVTKLFGGKEVDVPGGISKLKEGQPLDVFFLSRWAGVNPDNGSHQWLDKDGKTVSAFSPGNAVVLEGKTPDPTWYGNVGTSLEFKGVELSANFYYSGGNYIQNYMWSTLNSDGAGVTGAQAAASLNYWKKQGDVTDIPKPVLNGGQANWTNSTRFLQKGDFVRLRNVTLSYDLSKNVLGKSKIKGVRIYAQGQNLWTWTKEYKGDPEVGWGSGESGVSGTRGGLFASFSYPQTFGFTGGVDLTF